MDSEKSAYLVIIGWFLFLLGVQPEFRIHSYVASGSHWILWRSVFSKQPGCC